MSDEVIVDPTDPTDPNDGPPLPVSPPPPPPPPVSPPPPPPAPPPQIELPPILSDAPLDVPAKPAKSFNQWRPSDINIRWSNVNGEMDASITWQKYHRDPDTKVGEDAGIVSTHHEEALFAQAYSDPEIAQAMGALLVALRNKAKSRGIID